MRIWFNQGHTLYQSLRDMETRVPGVTLLVSAKNPMSPAALAGSETWADPQNMESAEYARWTLDQAVARDVDVFFPQKEVMAIADIADEFEKAGIRLELPGEASVIRLLDDKAAMAADLEGDDILAPTIRASSSDEVAAAVARIRSMGVEACVKPSHGVFAQGYWHLVDDDLLDCLDDIRSRRMPLATYLEAVAAADRQGRPIDLIVMEHLPGTEASVDMHVRNGEVLRAVTRVKVKGSRQLIVGGHELVEIAGRLAARYRLNGVINVQFKPDAKEKWRILEINPRMPGGLSYAMPLGVDLAADWVRVATGGRVEPVADSFSRMVNFYTESTIRTD